MTSIAFIGLGIMGSPMAVHLAEAGHDVIGYNPSPKRIEALVAAGGRAAASTAEGPPMIRVLLTEEPEIPLPHFHSGTRTQHSHTRLLARQLPRPSRHLAK